MVVYKHDGTEEVIKYAVVLSLLSLLLLLRGFLFLGSLDDQNVDCTDRCFGRINSQGATHTDNTQPAIGRKEEEEEEEEEERGGRRAGRGKKSMSAPLPLLHQFFRLSANNFQAWLGKFVRCALLVAMVPNARHMPLSLFTVSEQYRIQTAIYVYRSF